MKISSLIYELSAIREEYGDIEVMCDIGSKGTAKTNPTPMTKDVFIVDDSGEIYSMVDGRFIPYDGAYLHI